MRWRRDGRGRANRSLKVYLTDLGTATDKVSTFLYYLLLITHYFRVAA